MEVLKEMPRHNALLPQESEDYSIIAEKVKKLSKDDNEIHRRNENFECVEVKDKLRRVSFENDKLHIDNISLRKEIIELKAQLEGKSIDILTYRENFSDLKDKHEATKLAFDRLSLKLQTKEIMCSDLKMEVDKLRKEITRKSIRIDRAKDCHCQKNFSRISQRKGTELQKEAQIDDETKRLKAKYDDLLRKHTELKMELRKVNDDLSTQEANKIKFETLVGKLRSRVAELERARSSLNDALESESKEKQILSLQLKQFRAYQRENVERHEGENIKEHVHVKFQGDSSDSGIYVDEYLKIAGGTVDSSGKKEARSGQRNGTRKQHQPEHQDHRRYKGSPITVRNESRNLKTTKSEGVVKKSLKDRIDNLQSKTSQSPKNYDRKNIGRELRKKMSFSRLSKKKIVTRSKSEDHMEKGDSEADENVGFLVKSPKQNRFKCKGDLEGNLSREISKRNESESTKISTQLKAHEKVEEDSGERIESSSPGKTDRDEKKYRTRGSLKLAEMSRDSLELSDVDKELGKHHDCEEMITSAFNQKEEFSGDETSRDLQNGGISQKSERRQQGYVSLPDNKPHCNISDHTSQTQRNDERNSNLHRFERDEIRALVMDESNRSDVNSCKTKACSELKYQNNSLKDCLLAAKRRENSLIRVYDDLRNEFGELSVK